MLCRRDSVQGLQQLHPSWRPCWIPPCRRARAGEFDWRTVAVPASPYSWRPCALLEKWLVGGDWNHGVLWLSIQLGKVIPTDEVIFFRRAGQPPSRWGFFRDSQQKWCKMTPSWGFEHRSFSDFWMVYKNLGFSPTFFFIGYFFIEQYDDIALGLDFIIWRFL